MEEQDDNKSNGKKVNIYYLLIGTIFILFFAVYIFTRPAIFDSFVLVESGTLGDAIGGITSPIIGLLGAILVYKSFEAQIEANKLQRKIMKNEIERSNALKDFNTLMDVFKQIKEDYNDLKYGESYGKSAIIAFRAHFEVDPNRFRKKSFYNDFTYHIQVFNLLIDRVENSMIESADKNMLNNLIVFFYKSKLRIHVRKFIKICISEKTLPGFTMRLKKLDEKIENIFIED
ncbi:MAG TPA: hypothetical protein DCG75_14760 [Bacteroidales bacterium]|nr:hypothetical protein [Bacteroidales bacterium]